MHLAYAAVCVDPLGRHLQRDHHHRARAARAPRREATSALSAPLRCCDVSLLLYGVGGVIAPFVGIKLIDLLITAIHLA